MYHFLLKNYGHPLFLENVDKNNQIINYRTIIQFIFQSAENILYKTIVKNEYSPM